MNTKKLAKQILPPVIKSFITAKNSNKWVGEFDSWGEAQKKSKGYDNFEILQKVNNAIKKVKIGKAVYERDSMLFYEEDYDWQLLSTLFMAAKAGKLNILDFGGSLGSTYFQHRKMLDGINYTWNIVEQEEFVKEGKKFEDSHLHFYKSIEDCLKKNKINVIIFGSVLQYIKSYEKIIDQAISSGADYIFINRTPFTKLKEFVTIQKVPAKIYEASYPCRMINEKKLKKQFLKKYVLLTEFMSKDYINIDAEFKGFIFKRRKNE